VSTGHISSSFLHNSSITTYFLEPRKAAVTPAPVSTARGMDEMDSGIKSPVSPNKDSKVTSPTIKRISDETDIYGHQNSLPMGYINVLYKVYIFPPSSK